MTSLVKLAVPGAGPAAFVMEHWKLIVGGLVVAGLSIALMIARADAAHWKAADQQHVAAWQLEQAKHAVTRQSLATALASIDDINRAVDKLGADGKARQDAANKALSASQEAVQRKSGLLRALEASAAEKRPVGECKASAAYVAAKEEL